MNKLITLITIFTFIFFSSFVHSQTNCESARKKYLELNPDVAKAGINAWNHYINYGKNEGRAWPKCGVNNGNNEVKIGDQIWMAENLYVVSFQNGQGISQAGNKKEWDQLCANKQPAWCYYNWENKEEPKYGKIYNYYAIIDSRGIAPKGWHVPSDKEWDILINSIQPTAFGGANIPNVAGEKMKSISGWDDTFKISANGDNSSLFNGYPGGYYEYDSREQSYSLDFNGRIGISGGFYGLWWSSSIAKGDLNDPENCKIWYRSLHYKNDNVGKNSCSPGCGLTVRCVKDGNATAITDSLELIKLLNIESKKIQEQKKIEKSNFDAILKSKSSTKEAQFKELLSKIYQYDKTEPMLVVEILNRLIKLMPVNTSSFDKYDKEKASLFYLYYDRTKLKQKKLKDYNGALNDAKKCLTLQSNSKNPKYDRQSVMRTIQEIYEELGDIENARFWRYEVYKNSLEVYSEVSALNIEKSNQEISSMKLDYRYYCYTNINGRYQLGLDDGGAHYVTYQQYNLGGSLIKTVVGKWILQDEGVYGPAMILTISFTGKNAGLPSMKFNAQYDGFGNLQGLIDNQGRIWGTCR